MTNIEKMHNDHLDPDRYFADEPLTNWAIAEVFGDYGSLAELYRQVYKSTACGPTIGAMIAYVDETDEEGFPINKTEWFYCAELRQWGTFKDMDEQGALVMALSVSSIVEGIDATTETITIEIDHESTDPDEIRTRFWDAVQWVNSEAEILWNQTHGCDKCREWYEKQGVTGNEWGDFETGNTPIYEHCPQCYGHGEII